MFEVVLRGAIKSQRSEIIKQLESYIDSLNCTIDGKFIAYELVDFPEHDSN